MSRESDQATAPRYYPSNPGPVAVKSACGGPAAVGAFRGGFGSLQDPTNPPLPRRAHQAVREDSEGPTPTTGPGSGRKDTDDETTPIANPIPHCRRGARRPDGAQQR